MRIRFRSTASDPGQASLEFALVLPLVVVIVAATVWIGVVMRVQLALDHLAYRAARTAATAISHDELHMLVAGTISSTDETVRYEVDIADELVTVIVSREIPSPPFVARFVRDRLLSARATFRLEYVLADDRAPDEENR